jgi:hypothetical protein
VLKAIATKGIAAEDLDHRVRGPLRAAAPETSTRMR